jgi:hypothetical protein
LWRDFMMLRLSSEWNTGETFWQGGCKHACRWRGGGCSKSAKYLLVVSL